MFPDAKLLRTMETPQFFSFSHLLLQSRRPSSFQVIYFVAATVQQRSHIDLLPLWRPRTVLLFVCVGAVFPVVLRDRNEGVVSRASQFIGSCVGVQDDIHSHFLRI